MNDAKNAKLKANELLSKYKLSAQVVSIRHLQTEDAKNSKNQAEY